MLKIISSDDGIRTVFSFFGYCCRLPMRGHRENLFTDSVLVYFYCYVVEWCGYILLLTWVFALLFELAFLREFMPQTVSNGHFTVPCWAAVIVGEWWLASDSLIQFALLAFVIMEFENLHQQGYILIKTGLSPIRHAFLWMPFKESSIVVDRMLIVVTLSWYH